MLQAETIFDTKYWRQQRDPPWFNKASNVHICSFSTLRPDGDEQNV